MKAKRPVLAFSLIALLLGAVFLFLFPDAPTQSAVQRSESEDRLQAAQDGLPIASSQRQANGPHAIDSQAPHGSGAVSIVVRDMADGAPVPDVRLALRSSTTADKEELRTSMDGSVQVPVTSVEGLSVDPGGWHTPDQTAEEIRQSGVLWCYRTMRVTGRVEEESGPVRLKAPASIEAVCALGVQAARQGTHLYYPASLP